MNMQAMQVADHTYSYTFSSRYFGSTSLSKQAETLYRTSESFNGVCPCRICCNNPVAK